MTIEHGRYIEFDDIGNYYGSLCITEDDGKYYWAIQNYNGHFWQPISEQLFNALMVHYKETTDDH